MRESPKVFLRVNLLSRNNYCQRYDGSLSHAVVRPAKAGMFSRSQSRQGKNQKPCSLDGRFEGNRLKEDIPEGED